MSGHCKICGDTGCNSEHHDKPYKEQVIDSAIQGLIDGGYSYQYAEKYRVIFDRLYTIGYNEAMRMNRS